MAKERVDASLDAFDALIAGLADAGEVARSEVTKLRSQQEIPQTSEITIPSQRWSMSPAAVPAVDAAPAPAPASAAPTAAAQAAATPAAPSQPMTRREARALREAQERQAQQEPEAPRAQPQQHPHPAPDFIHETDVEADVEAENVRRTEDQIHSHRVRPPQEENPVAAASAPRPRRRSARRTMLATAGAVSLIPSLWLVVPASAETTPGPQTVDASGHTAQQILQVADNVKSPTIESQSFLATALASIVAKEGGASAAAAAPAIMDALALGGARAQIIETALSYIGTPYVLGGDSHTGIDCSGLTMEAYAAVGIHLAHYVPTQDAVGTEIPQSQAKAGDLVVFDNEDHVGIYLGDNQVLAAPAPGRRVSIESVDLWRPIGIHFTRILPAGQ